MNWITLSTSTIFVFIIICIFCLSPLSLSLCICSLTLPNISIHYFFLYMSLSISLHYFFLYLSLSIISLSLSVRYLSLSISVHDLFLSISIHYLILSFCLSPLSLTTCLSSLSLSLCLYSLVFIPPFLSQSIILCLCSLFPSLALSFLSCSKSCEKWLRVEMIFSIHLPAKTIGGNRLRSPLDRKWHAQYSQRSIFSQIYVANLIKCATIVNHDYCLSCNDYKL